MSISYNSKTQTLFVIGSGFGYEIPKVSRKEYEKLIDLPSSDLFCVLKEWNRK